MQRSGQAGAMNVPACPQPRAVEAGGSGAARGVGDVRKERGDFTSPARDFFRYESSAD